MTRDEKLEKITVYLTAKKVEEGYALTEEPVASLERRATIYVYYKPNAPRRHLRISWEALDDFPVERIIDMIKVWDGKSGFLVTTKGTSRIDDIPV